MVNQEIAYFFQPSQIRSAVMRFTWERLKDPRLLWVWAVLLILLYVGLCNMWMSLIAIPLGITTALLLIFIHYVVTSQKNYCGLEVHMAVREDGLYFSSTHREGMVTWAGFKEIYLLKKMWAVFFKNSDAVTFIPTDQLTQETLDYMLARLRENEVKIKGEVRRKG